MAVGQYVGTIGADIEQGVLACNLSHSIINTAAPNNMFRI